MTIDALHALRQKVDAMNVDDYSGRRDVILTVLDWIDELSPPLPCPFCQQKYLTCEEEQNEEGIQFYSMCSVCNAKGPPVPSPAQARRAWNSRGEATDD